MGHQQPFVTDDSDVVADARGCIASRSLHQHTERLAPQMYEVAPRIWCLVGNGLSNQTFIEGPEGIIAIDTGESIEEMDSALEQLRVVSDQPVVAVVYTHFHYVNGTAALIEKEPIHAIWGHERISRNLERSATEIAPAYTRGLIEQFGIQMPEDGPDGLVNVGLGLAYRMAHHAPSTPGHVPADHTFFEDCSVVVAGLKMIVTQAPSDADDSVTLYFPELKVAVQNLVWPALFNIFAIRGEEYRDPRVLIKGIDHLRTLEVEHLLATHGPPLSGMEEIQRRVTAYRDSIQFLWDQTVRWTNRGATGPELAHRIQLPAVYDDDWLTKQHYGLAEHHVRQIRSGLFGFFDGDPIGLLPLDTSEEAERMVSAMGGPEQVRSLCDEALEGSQNDLRWAISLAGRLAHRPGASEIDRQLLATALRTAAQRTTSSNLRNWCITRALDLEGHIDGARLNTHRFSRRQVEQWSTDAAVSILRVLIDPDKLVGVDFHLAIELDGERTGIHFRNHIACPTDGQAGEAVLSGSRATWNQILTGSTDLQSAISSGDMALKGDLNAVINAVQAVDHPGFQ
ncbi:MAG: alkyl sulfatase dimerization domain-containing protein [Actinomycetota bacterium]|nr:alkyl sulfatase dimerization domain-containing protein [Actinomycetota bacterium]